MNIGWDGPSMELVNFLLARISEAEKVARGAGIIAWLTYLDPDGFMQYTDVAAATVEAPDEWVTDGREAEGFTSVQVIYDERRVLAECRAKREIVLGSYWGRNDAYVEGPVADEVCRILASADRDHPDYKKEWTPTW